MCLLQCYIMIVTVHYGVPLLLYVNNKKHPPCGLGNFSYNDYVTDVKIQTRLLAKTSGFGPDPTFTLMVRHEEKRTLRKSTIFELGGEILAESILVEKQRRSK
jgi:hypothetical protein